MMSLESYYVSNVVVFAPQAGDDGITFLTLLLLLHRLVMLVDYGAAGRDSSCRRCWTNTHHLPHYFHHML